VAEIRADLACCDRDGVPWPAAARRLLADVPALLAEVEAAHRFEQSVAVERQALLAEVEMCRRIRDEMQDVAGAAVAAKAGAHVDLDAARADLASLRGVVQAVRELAGLMSRAGDQLWRGSEAAWAISKALAATADAPQPEPCGVEWVGCYAADLHYSCGEPKGHEGNHRAGPSPAVLPEKEQQR
jgi:hypothetical protein